MAAVTVCRDSGSKMYWVTVSPSIFHEVMGPDAVILVSWMLSFNPLFSLSSFTFFKRLFSSSLSALRVVSSPCLGLLIFLPAILIPVCVSSSPAFLMMWLELCNQDLYRLTGNWIKRHIQRETYTPICTLSMTKETRIYNGENIVSSMSGAGKTGQFHVKE